MSVPDAVARDIHERLDAAEREHDVRIVHACESSGRAWGFASPDSDYDVRFVYVRRPEWYLSFDVERRRDVIAESAPNGRSSTTSTSPAGTSGRRCISSRAPTARSSNG